ncbi:MAG: SDR family NAD(P)-dependent oxidoreductase [Hyphomicrobiaceae bacterium]
MAERGTGSRPAAIVTGAGSGIGRATAGLLLERGWCVAVLDRDAKGLAEIEAHYAGDDCVIVREIDVTDEPAVERLVSEVVAKFSRLDGVVNSAGIAADKHVFDTSAELFRRILDVNVVGTFLVGREAARHMAKAGRGAIINVASISGLRGSKGRSAYGASKGAVINLTQVMANDLAPHGIRVNAVAPGPVETPLAKSLHTAADRALYGRHIPMRRYAEPKEIATVIHFLLDETQSSYVTGEIIAVDGGYRGAGLITDPA